jgi:hypothetical protein
VYRLVYLIDDVGVGFVLDMGPFVRSGFNFLGCGIAVNSGIEDQMEIDLEERTGSWALARVDWGVNRHVR